MIAIYVTKKWIQTIGGASDLLLFETEQKSEYAILMAQEKELIPSSPFVHAEVTRHPSTMSESKKPFIPVWIPTTEIAAIFNFTEADSKKIGFKTE